MFFFTSVACSDSFIFSIFGQVEYNGIAFVVQYVLSLV